MNGLINIEGFIYSYVHVWFISEMRPRLHKGVVDSMCGNNDGVLSSQLAKCWDQSILARLLLLDMLVFICSCPLPYIHIGKKLARL